MSNQRFYRKLMTLALRMLLIICSGDIKTNPGAKKNTKIALCHWNLNESLLITFLNIFTAGYGCNTRVQYYMSVRKVS